MLNHYTYYSAPLVSNPTPTPTQNVHEEKATAAPTSRQLRSHGRTRIYSTSLLQGHSSAPDRAPRNYFDMLACGGGTPYIFFMCVPRVDVHPIPPFPLPPPPPPSRLLTCACLSLQAQIEDGHGTAERVSSSVRRLDDIQMRVQRALALVEDVINLRGCADVSKSKGLYSIYYIYVYFTRGQVDGRMDGYQRYSSFCIDSSTTVLQTLRG